MCGIAGIVARNTAVNNIELLKGMTRSLTHRGPDAEGYYSSNQVSLGHRRLAIIDTNPRGNTTLKQELSAEEQRLGLINFERPEESRYKERSNVERVNGRLKDEFGGKMVRVRGNAKVMTHLMFGIIALTADQLIRFVT